MTKNLDLKNAIQDALNDFDQKPLKDAAISLFETLGYKSEKRLNLKPNTSDQFREQFDAQKKLDTKKALFETWTSVDVLFQITDEEIRQALAGQRSMFASGQVNETIINSYLFFAIGLQKSDKPYTRSELATITREVNRLFMMPVMILFRHNETISIAIIRRRLNKRDKSFDVLDKITLIKDIRFTENRPHLEILKDLAISELANENKITNFVDLHHAWEKTLDINELNKKFYKEIANWYFWALDKVTFPVDADKDEEKRNATSLIRLITRLIFVWFIKEKALVPEDLFDEARVREILLFEDPNNSTYYKAVLQNLFFATLNTEMGKDRKFRSENQGKGQNGNWMEHDRYRYKKYFKDPDTALHLFSKIPFLNGGLFECLDKEIEIDGKNKTKRVDGFSDHPDNKLCVPDELFFNSEITVDLNEIYDTRGKKYNVRGLLDIFNSYKFTIEENTPIEEEVALDPELLGKVFENLLASFNPETNVTARKQTGSFYTPREIVNYMVDEVLIHYLADKFADSKNLEERLWKLFSYREDDSLFTEIEKKRLVDAIDSLKVIDPACGSGAFPMGILHKLVYMLSKLDPGNLHWKAKQITKASEIEDPAARQAAIVSIEKVFNQNFNNYGRKLFLIENTIFGVDIQPIAVQISKLRVFISLVVDQKVDRSLPNLNISPLPNLETKFITANSLIRINRPQRDHSPKPDTASLQPELVERCNELINKLRLYIKSRNPNLRNQYLEDGRRLALEINKKLKDWPDFQPVNVDWIFPTASNVDVLTRQLPLARPQKVTAMALTSSSVDEIEIKLDIVRRNHFSARRPQEKRKYREQDALLRAQLMDNYRKLGLEGDDAMKMVSWDPYDQNTAASFFDIEWMFNLQEGFDVVIGNPPYLRVQGIQKTQGEFMDYYRNHYESATGSFDLYALFIEMGYKLLNSGGQLAYIVPHKFLQSSFGSGLRRMLTERQALHQLMRFGAEQIFEESTTYTSLLFLTRRPNKDFDLIEVKSLERGDEVLQAVRGREDNPDYTYDTLLAPVISDQKANWDFVIGVKDRVLRRLQNHPKRLKDLIRKIFQGLATSADKLFVLELLSEKDGMVRCFSKHIEQEIEIESGLVKPFLMGKDLHRYEPVKARNVVIFPYLLTNNKAQLMTQEYIKNNYPKGWQYLKKNEKDLGDRENGRMYGNEFYAYIYPKNMTEFERIKIVTPEIALGCQMSIDTEGVFYHTTKVYSFIFNENFKASIKFMLGILNSKVLWFFLKSTGYVLRGGYFTFKTNYLKPFPIAESTPEQELAVETLVDYILTLKGLPEPSSREKEMERLLMISFFEQIIDGLVYELYFPEEFIDAGESIFALLTPDVLPTLRELKGDTETILQNLFHNLYDTNHPVRKMIYFLDTIETVSVIEGKTKGL